METPSVARYYELNDTAARVKTVVEAGGIVAFSLSISLHLPMNHIIMNSTDVERKNQGHGWFLML